MISSEMILVTQLEQSDLWIYARSFLLVDLQTILYSIISINPLYRTFYQSRDILIVAPPAHCLH